MGQKLDKYLDSCFFEGWREDIAVSRILSEARSAYGEVQTEMNEDSIDSFVIGYVEGTRRLLSKFSKDMEKMKTLSVKLDEIVGRR